MGSFLFAQQSEDMHRHAFAAHCQAELCYALPLQSAGMHCVAKPCFALAMRRRAKLSISKPLRRSAVYCFAKPLHLFKKDLLPFESTFAGVSPLSDASKLTIVEPFPHGIFEM